MQFSFLPGNEITLKNLVIVIWSNLRKMLIWGSGVRGPDIHHGPGFLQSWGWAGHEAGYQMRMSDMWWVISLITTHSATSYNHSVYYQEWWVQLESQESNEPLSAILIQFSRPESDLKDVGPILNFRNSHIPASQWWSTGAGFLSDLIKFSLRAKYGHGCILGPVWSYPGRWWGVRTLNTVS